MFGVYDNLKALVHISGGRATVLNAIPKDFWESEFEKYGIDAEDLGLIYEQEGLKGLYIWEGSAEVEPDDTLGITVYYTGELRPITQEESDWFCRNSLFFS